MQKTNKFQYAKNKQILYLRFEIYLNFIIYDL